jgi:hypothetical protein
VGEIATYGRLDLTVFVAQLLKCTMLIKFRQGFRIVALAKVPEAGLQSVGAIGPRQVNGYDVSFLSNL